MTHNQKTLSLVEKIAKSSKYVKIITNDTENTYIWHSEHGKNSCENCSSLDNVKFYPGDKMPTPPLHPNCRCELEEIKEYSLNNNNSNNALKGSISKEELPEYEPFKESENQKEITPKKEQETKTTQSKSTITAEKAQEELKKTEDKLQEISFTTNKINKTIEEDIDYDFQILNEQIEAISPSFDMDLDLLESEKENHEPNCIEFKKRKEEINKRKEQFNKIKNEVEDNKKKVEEIRKRLKEIDGTDKSIDINIKFLKEKLAESYTYDNVAVQDLLQNINSLSNEIKQLLSNIHTILKSNNTLKNKLSEILKTQSQPIAKIICDCAITIDVISKVKKRAVIDEIGKVASPFFPVGGSNIQDAMHDFEYAKKNPNAEVLNSRKELSDDSLNIPLNRAKVPEASKGVVYKPASLQSQKIFYSKVIQNYIEENLEALIEADGKPLPDKDLGFAFWPEPDAYLGIQHFILHGPKITKDGYFEADLVDYYDFTKRKIKTLSDFIKVPINNTGHAMQEAGLLQNYFEIYHIKERIW